MRCEHMVTLPEWMNKPNRQCSRSASVMVQGMAVCGVHAFGRTPQTPIGDHMISALREIAHGASGNGPATDVAVMQSIARRALGEIG